MLPATSILPQLTNFAAPSMNESSSYASHLLAVMDRLWFRHIILSSEPRTNDALVALQSNSSSCESSHSDEDNASTNSSSCSVPQMDFNDEVAEKLHESRLGRKRPSRLNLQGNKNRSQSSSPSINRPEKSLPSCCNNSKGPKLQKYLSCSTDLHDLEVEELKGFMDLGFEFEKDHLSRRTMSVIPGLQRLGENDDDATTDELSPTTTMVDDVGDENGEKKMGGSKPYLSEAWLVKRPNSPLLRLRMARVSTAVDMKKCLKLWARTVATSIQSDE